MRAIKASFAVIGLSALLAGGAIGGVGTANAATPCVGGYPPAECTVQINSDLVVPGQLVGFSASGFSPGEIVDGVVGSSVVHVGAFVANAQGIVTGSFTVPFSLAAGNHTFILTGRTSGVIKTVAFTVTAAAANSSSGATGVTSAAGSTGSTSSGALPRTGADVAGLVGGGAAVVLVGGVLMVAAGRRKRTSPSA